MDLTYDEQLLLLDRIVADGLTRLLTEARENQYLEEPYGRTVEPTPLISEEEFVRAGGLQGSLADEPDFNFQYGFNPLQYLSKFITWSHPNSVEGRRQEKLKAVERLCARAAHAQEQLDSSLILREKVQQFSSGIYWGPFVSPIPFKEDPMRNLNDSTVLASTCSVIVMCKALKTGFVNLQLSQAEDFSTLDYSTARVVGYRAQHKIEGAEEEETVLLEDIQPVKIVVDGLQFSTQYYVRVYLSDRDDSVPLVVPSVGSEDEYDHHSTTEEAAGAGAVVGPTEVPHAQVTRFWTLPSEEVVLPPPAALDEGAVGASAAAFTCSPLTLLCFGQQPAPSISTTSTSSSVVSSIAGEGPVYSALIGDLLYSNPDLPHYCSGAVGVSSFGPLNAGSLSDNQISALYSRSPVFSGSESSAVLRTSCALLAPRDSSDSSRRHLNSEEVNHKQFRHDLRRYNKKYPPAGSQGAGAKGGKGAASKGTAATATTTAVVAPPAPTIKRLPLTDSLHSLLELFPVSFTENYDPVVPSPAELAKIKDKKQLKALMEPVVLGTRMLYRTVMLGPDIQIIILDMRGSPQEGGASYLGREQAAWLTGQLMDSSSLWKVVLCGYSFGLVGLSESESSGEEEAIENHDNNNYDDAAVEEGFTSAAAAATGEAVDSNGSAPAAATKTKQFKLQEPEEEDKKAGHQHPLLDEEVEEVYSRSKHSLPHVLATVQKKYHTPSSSSSAALAAENAGGELFLSSGIVVLSSGVCKVVQPGSALQVPHSNGSSSLFPQEAVSPSFVATYSTLLGNPSPDFSPLGCGGFSDAGVAAYCAEIGLGSTTGSTVASSFGFLAGFEANTLFDARQAVCDADVGTAVGRLSLTSDGALKVAIVAGNSSSTDSLLYEVTLRTHLLDASSLEETEDGASTVQENQ